MLVLALMVLGLAVAALRWSFVAARPDERLCESAAASSPMQAWASSFSDSLATTWFDSAARCSA